MSLIFFRSISASAQGRPHRLMLISAFLILEAAEHARIKEASRCRDLTKRCGPSSRAKRHSQALRNIDDVLPDRRQGQLRQLQILEGERNADDRDGFQDRHENVRQGDVPPGEDEPDDIEEEAGAARAEIAVAGIVGAVDDLAAEGPEDEAGDAPGGHGPGKADNGAGQDQAAEEPQAARHEAAEKQPEKIEQKSHGHTPNELRAVIIAIPAARSS